MESTEVNINSSIDNFIEFNRIDIGYMKYDKRLSNLDMKVKKWLSYIDDKDRKVFLKLFENFTYIDRLKVIDILGSLYNEYKKIEENYQETIFLPVVSFGGVFNGSVSVMECFIEAVSDEKYVSKKHIATQPSEFYDEFDISGIKNIVLIDDVIGSGDTLIDSLLRLGKRAPRLLYNKNIYILTLINLKKGMENVKAFSKERGWDIEFINSSFIDSFFSSEKLYPSENDSIRDKKIIRKHEKKIASKSIYIMGYKRSEALLGFFYNTPNNTLSTFWEEVDNEWSSLFPRDKDEDVLSLNQRNTLREIRSLRKEKDDKQYFLSKQIKLEKQSRGVL